MHFIELSVNSNRVVFSTMTQEQVFHYIFSFYTDEQLAAFRQDAQYCMDNAWLHPTEDHGFYEGLGQQLIKVDPATNNLKITFIAHQIEKLCENLFDPPKIGTNPVIDYYNANPSEGNLSVRVMNSNGSDVTSEYSYT